MIQVGLIENINQITNTGGKAGAWLSDLLLYLFVASAWWLVALFIAAIIWSYRRIDIVSLFDPRSLIISLIGFVTCWWQVAGLKRFGLIH
ncbi:MAG: DNA translocase FtsK 4TM domain-containing protein [Nitrosomonas sp.]|nr:DNA translocase FtsK 4TM domain-containing protein [Nitrosomonas sp.]